MHWSNLSILSFYSFLIFETIFFVLLYYVSKTTRYPVPSGKIENLNSTINELFFRNDKNDERAENREKGHNELKSVYKLYLVPLCNNQYELRAVKDFVGFIKKNFPYQSDNRKNVSFEEKPLEKEREKEMKNEIFMLLSDLEPEQKNKNNNFEHIKIEEKSLLDLVREESYADFHVEHAELFNEICSANGFFGKKEQNPFKMESSRLKQRGDVHLSIDSTKSLHTFFKLSKKTYVLYFYTPLSVSHSQKDNLDRVHTASNNDSQNETDLPKLFFSTETFAQLTISQKHYTLQNDKKNIKNNQKNSKVQSLPSSEPDLLLTSTWRNVLTAIHSTWFSNIHIESFFYSEKQILSFWLAGDDFNKTLSWNFYQDVYKPYLYNFFNKLKLIFDFQIQSQVINVSNISSLLTKEKKEENENIVQILKFKDASLIRKIAYKWNSNYLVLNKTYAHLAALNFVVYIPNNLTAKAEDENGDLHSAMHISNWGVLTLFNIHKNNTSTEGTRHLSKEEAREIAGFWISSFRLLLNMPPISLSSYLMKSFNYVKKYADNSNVFIVGASQEGMKRGKRSKILVEFENPEYNGITEWELLNFIRNFYAQILIRTTRNLVATNDIINEFTNIKVQKNIPEAIEHCIKGLQCSMLAHEGSSCNKLLADLEFDERFEQSFILAINAYKHSLEILHDDSLIEAYVFSLQQKIALYMPILFPMIFPLLFNFTRKLKKGPKVKII